MSPFTRMVAVIAACWLPLKLLCWRASGVRLTPSRAVAWIFLWPGMDPAPFAKRARRPLPGACERLATGIGALVASGILWCVACAELDAGHPRVAGIIALPALSLGLHFGICNLLTAAWLARGHDVRAPFENPLGASSLGVFWGDRWNRAFSEMTALLIYRPLAARAGKPVALFAAFAWSGLLHELAVSVPVGAGYGGPLAYFLLHGALVARERRTGRPANPLPWLLLPLPLLFHAPFIDGVVMPLLRLH